MIDPTTNGIGARLYFEAELAGSADALVVLADALSTGSPRVRHDGQTYFLAVAEFHEADSADAALQAAERHLQILRVVCSHVLRQQMSLDVAAIVEHAPGGGRRRILFGDVHERVNAEDSCSTSEDASPTRARADDIRRLQLLSDVNPWIRSAVITWGDPGLSWSGLYKIYEDLLHALSKAGFQLDSHPFSKARLKRFTESANTPAASGYQSRHGGPAHDKAAPRSPLTFQEAKLLISELLQHTCMQLSTDSLTTKAD